MKTCSKCREEKPVSSFPGQLVKHCWCKECHSINNKENRSKKNKASRELVKKRKMQCIEYKGGYCARCGNLYQPAVMEFHHKNPDNKDFVIRDIIRRRWDLIQQELDKCDLLCANCHRLVHAELREGQDGET